MLTLNITRRVAIPHEAGQWIDLRMLSYRQFDEAREAKVAASMASIAKMPGDLLGQITATRAQAGAADQADIDPLVSTYDTDTLLRLGVAGWSYEEPVTLESVRSLDTATAQWAARALLTLHERTDEEKKRGS